MGTETSKAIGTGDPATDKQRSEDPNATLMGVKDTQAGDQGALCCGDGD